MAYVTLEEAKKHLNIDADFTDDDDYVTSLISAAEKVVALDICVPLEELEEEPGKIPAPLRQAVLLMVGNYYVSRESLVFGAVVHETPSYKHLIGLYRDYSK